ncbi:MAG: DUF4442 domain-containing protein [Mucilaginibacter sp.]
MVVSENLLKWLLRLYPPLFFQRIWVVKINNGFAGARVKISHSLLNRNYNKSIFGGTIFSAADPFYPALFHQVLSKKGYHIKVWSRSVEVQFLKPGLTNLYFDLVITEQEIVEIVNLLDTVGKYVQAHPIDIYNIDGKKCVSLMIEVHIRNLNFIEIT